MFSTITSRLLLGVYVFILLSIPVGSYLIAQSRTSSTNTPTASKTTPKPTAKTTPKPTLRPALESPAPFSSDGSPEIAKTFGPTLSFTASLEGHPANNQAIKMFVGIIEGVLGSNPKFLLSFSVDLPANGTYSNLSLAGLNPGSTYTAFLKGSAQIATASAFTMSPSVTKLNGGEAIFLRSGDLNEDNMVNTADYTIVQRALGSTPSSANWNENADINKDGVVNTFDLGIATKNIGAVGVSGAWTSPIPAASASAGLASPPVGSPEGGGDGYWIWIPQTN